MRGHKLKEKMPIVKKTLEKILGEERLERWSRKVWGFSVEAFVMNTFSYAFCAPIELGFAGMDLMEHLKTRAAGVITNTLVARPYGIIRDKILKTLGITKESHWIKKYLGDTLSIATLFPVYWVNTAFGDVESNEVITAFIPIALVAGGTGGIYGAYLDWTRRKCGIPIGYETGDSGGEK